MFQVSTTLQGQLHRIQLLKPTDFTGYLLMVGNLVK